MSLTEQEIRNREQVLALYRNVLDPHDTAARILVENYIQHIFAQDDHVIVHPRVTRAGRGRPGSGGYIQAR